MLNVKLINDKKHFINMTYNLIFKNIVFNVFKKKLQKR